MKVLPKKQEGKAIGFNPIAEAWSAYKLADGNVLRIKIVLLKVLKTKNIRPDGIPIYNFESTNVAAVLTPQQFIELSQSENPQYE